MSSNASGNNYTRMSEVIAVPVPTTPTSPNGVMKFQGEGLAFKAKLIGMEDLPVDRDEKVCLESMFKLKAVAKARGEHKQRIQMNLTMSSVKLTDETTKTLIANHQIEQISFVVLDPRDTRAFGYIYNTSDDRHQFLAIKTEKSAAITVLALKELFELAFEKFSQETPTKETTTEVVPPIPKTETSVNPPVSAIVEDTPSPPPVPPEVVKSVAPVLEPSATLVIPDLFDRVDEPFNAVSFTNPSPPVQKATTISLLDDLGDLYIAPPAPVQPANDFDQWTTFLNPPAAPTNNPTASLFTSPPPILPVVPQASVFVPPPIVTPVAAPIFNSPISPIAPPTVSNPLLDLDFFGPTTTTKITKDQFFPQQQKPTIAQLQTDPKP